MVTAIVREFGVSGGYVYEITTGVRPPRKRRMDSAYKRIELSEDQQIHIVAQIVRNGASAVAALSAATDAENNKQPWYITPGEEPTSGTLNRWLRDLNLSYRARKQVSSLTPYTRREATKANEIWFVDATVGEQFYLAPDGEHIYWHDPTDRQKPRDPRAVIWAIVDGYSRVTYMDIYEHESSLSLCEFLYDAMLPKEHNDEFPFSGIPNKLYSDPGPALRAAKTGDFCIAFDVARSWHKPKHAWSKGIVERAFRSLIDRQKLRKLAPRWTRREFRNFLYRYCLAYNNRVHSATGEAPFERWAQSIESGEGVWREAAPAKLARYLLHDRLTRTLTAAGTLKINNREFHIGRAMQTRLAHLVGHEVEVLVDPERKDEIYLHHQGEVYALTARSVIPFEKFSDEGRPPAFSEREKMLALVESDRAKEILESVKGVGLPASGPAHTITRKPISWQEQIAARGGPEREAVSGEDARLMLHHAKLIGPYEPTREIATTLLNKLIAEKDVAGESIYRDEVIALMAEIEELEKKGGAGGGAAAEPSAG